MRVWSTFILALTVAVVASGPSYAQRGGFGGGFGFGPGQLIANKDVQKELNLSEEEIEKANKLSKELQAKQREAFAALQDVPQEERREKFQEVMKKVNEEADKAIGELLKPE